MRFPSRRTVSAARRGSSAAWSAWFQSIDDVARRSMHQVRYLGEWHSHPRYATSRPSNTDQIAYLGSELATDIAIAAHQGDFSLLSFDPALCRQEGRILKVAIHRGHDWVADEEAISPKIGLALCKSPRMSLFWHLKKGYAALGLTRLSDDLRCCWRPPRSPTSTQAGFF
jgi:hypothetical protein